MLLQSCIIGIGVCMSCTHRPGFTESSPSGRARLPVSVFLISFNEEGRIAAAIDSVRDWAAEVLVVDCGSTDATATIAQERGAKVIHNPWPGYGAQKRFAEGKCSSRWVLNLDADERVTAALAGEIADLFAGGAPEHDGYEIFTADVFPHEDRPAPWASGKWFLRLYDCEKGRFSTSPVHDSVEMQAGASIRRLRGILHHRSQPSIGFAMDKMNRYSDMQVADMRARGRHIPPWRLLYEFPLATLKCYFLRRAFLYGINPRIHLWCLLRNGDHVGVPEGKDDMHLAIIIKERILAPVF